ncbi:uncharacterized protein DS421_5g143600 [Arachis hypogaea]|nr:uncharacterized protein DS421_5g143600 [Arachis hypogaea]
MHGGASPFPPPRDLFLSLSVLKTATQLSGGWVCRQRRRGYKLDGGARQWRCDDRGELDACWAATSSFSHCLSSWLSSDSRRHTLPLPFDGDYEKHGSCAWWRRRWSRSPSPLRSQISLGSGLPPRRQRWRSQVPPSGFTLPSLPLCPLVLFLSFKRGKLCVLLRSKGNGERGLRLRSVEGRMGGSI